VTINIEHEASTLEGIDEEDIVKRVITEAMDYVDCPYEAEVNVLFTDNDGIQAINKEFRSLDAPTDVLSFPMVDYETPADFSVAEAAAEEYFNPESGELLLGDIVLSVDRIRSQAEAYGHSITRELAFLTAHSMLHLFGYDHMEAEEAKVMEAKQEEILSRLNITR
jgi:probable rRNA maturation factor